jgi:hypothetical protein
MRALTDVTSEALRRWRESQGWDVPRMARELRKVARDSGEDVAAHHGLVKMIPQWEQGARAPRERYRLLYLKVFEDAGLSRGMGLGVDFVLRLAEVRTRSRPARPRRNQGAGSRRPGQAEKNPHASRDPRPGRGGNRPPARGRRQAHRTLGAARRRRGRRGQVMSARDDKIRQVVAELDVHIAEVEASVAVLKRSWPTTSP